MKKKPAPVVANLSQPQYSALAELTLNSIADGVLLIDGAGLIKYANPAAAELMGYGSPSNLVGLDYQAVLRLETANGLRVTPENSKLVQAIKTNQPTTLREYILISAQSERKAAIAITVTPTGGAHADKILTFRNITEELKEEEKQSEFISTASHEMRTPVASIEGYLGLALNPQTASIDARARQYLDAAHAASQHLGRLFKDLLDVTKLDDGHLKVHAVPVEMVSTVRKIAAQREKEMQAKQIKYSFGTSGPVTGDKQIDQLVYAAVDLSFLQEILDNLIENAIKYTPEGGEIWINARGDGDKVLINVTDTGIGVSPEDAGHIFQKFYRADNSQTRQIGGTGLGLYLVKQRTEAMGGRVWVESAFGDGSTFFVSLPRISNTEYQKLLLAYQNEQAAQAAKQKTTASAGAAVGISGAPAGDAPTPVKSDLIESDSGAGAQAQATQASGAQAQPTAPVANAQVQPAAPPPKPVPAGPLAEALVKAGVTQTTQVTQAQEQPQVMQSQAGQVQNAASQVKAVQMPQMSQMSQMSSTAPSNNINQGTPS